MNLLLPYMIFTAITLIAIWVLLKKKKPQLYEKYLPAILNNINEAIIGVDPGSKIIFANDATGKILKYNAKYLIGKNIDQIFDGSPLVADNKINCIDSNHNKIPVKIIVKQINDIGNIYVINDTTSVKNDQKKIEDVNLEVENKNNKINQLKQEIEKAKASNEEKIRQRSLEYEEEHARLLASISNLNLGFIMTDKYQNILLYNIAAYYILPSLYTKSKTIKDLCMHEQINYDLNKELEESMLKNKNTSLADIQANLQYVNFYISPIILDNKPESDCLGTVILIIDKTEQHRLEESKEDLFSIASHELRTPLTAIYGYTSLIKQIYFNDLRNEELKEIINKIGILSNKLSLNVNNFLDSQKLEQGKIELKKEQCDLYTIINEALKETERSSMEKNLYIKFDSPITPIIVSGDQKRLIQIMTILLDNAIKFTQNGGVRISIQALNNFAKIIIQDTGIGIPEENKILLFNKFQQAEENLLTRQEGTGLGLHIAKLLIEKMGGTIALEKSEINKGSTFSFTVPLY